MTQPVLAPRPIQALVRRHAEDAAFYWSQLDGSTDSVLLRPDAVSGFQLQLEAHLEGLRAAGEDGLQEALTQLERWRKPGEAFVAVTQALSLGQGRRTPGLLKAMQWVGQQPELLLRGALSALARAAAPVRATWVQTALTMDDPVELVMALRALALAREPLPQWQRWAAHPSPHVRAAACRGAGQAQQDTLPALVRDPDVAVAAEAAIAIGRWAAAAQAQADGPVGAAELWRSVEAQQAVLQGASGWDRHQAQRRLRRWVRHLARIAPVGHPGLRPVMQTLPRRLALEAVLHHGDPAHLDLVLAAMNDPAHARWAGWVWQSLTGVDLIEAGLVVEEPPLDLDAPLDANRQDADLGLPLPDPARVAALAGVATNGAGMRMLLGRPVTAPQLRAWLTPSAEQPQALRHVAAQTLAWMHPDYPLDLRASEATQRQQLRRMGASVD